ncbi:uncharacterized protein F4807DRAFT_458274 [Annulohypoxylon truncatum]|uniref:uncharacterized protein n=1 Tax=Annulohypoxylon truncatum TaxID=327061 RepID=UPI0020089D35|nr:uncharacterized protein F4807DRAFT_458274 [Annulohypoxylon truncatum]KAI1212073.1 hypothetical protein F4807DRAFT_458274 [Annulohypoxylon truncatum]
MGQTASSSQPQPDLENQLESPPGTPRKIDTAEKFQHYFSHEFREDYQPLIERYELREALGISFEMDSDCYEGQLCWDKHALVDSLNAAVPVELKTDLNFASPLLLKTMIRLGSFPFHNRQTSSTLGADEALLAITFLLRWHEDATVFSFEDEEDDPDEVQRLRDRWFHRLLFQVMSDKPYSNSQHNVQEQDKILVRDPADDEHLIQTRQVLEENNYTRNRKSLKLRVQLPPVIEVSELPSSRSRDLTGSIPRDEFRALLKVLCGISKNSSVDVDQLVETQGTDWSGFDAILTKLEPQFSSGIRQLFNPLIHYSDWLPPLDTEDQAIRKPDI